MKKLSLAVAFATLALTSLAGAQGLSDRARSRSSCPTAPGGPADTMGRTMAEAMRPPSASRRDRERHRRERHDRRRPHGARRAGRLHGRASATGRRSSPTARSTTSTTTSRRTSSRSCGLPHNPYIAVVRKDFPAKDFKEMIAWLKANPGQGDRGHRRPRLRPAHQRRLFPEGHRHAIPVRAVQGRLRRHHPRHGGGPHRLHLRSGHHLAVAYQGRQREGAMRSPPTSGSTPRPTFRPWTRPARRASTSRPGTGCGCRRARRRRRSTSSATRPARRWPIPPCAPSLRSLGQQIPPPEQQSAAALAAFTKAEIDKWHPMIKEAGIKAE